MTCRCDVADPAAVTSAVGYVMERFGRIDALIYCAGTNITRRSWEQLSIDDYHLVLATNLDDAVHCIHAVLPAMRRQGAGTIVVINSEAGRAATAKSGTACGASKVGFAGVVQSVNAEERARGIRARSIFPGDVDTLLLRIRPNPPSAEARAKMLQPDDVAACVWLALASRRRRGTRRPSALTPVSLVRSLSCNR